MLGLIGDVRLTAKEPGCGHASADYREDVIVNCSNPWCPAGKKHTAAECMLDERRYATTHGVYYGAAELPGSIPLSELVTQLASVGLSVVADERAALVLQRVDELTFRSDHRRRMLESLLGQLLGFEMPLHRAERICNQLLSEAACHFPYLRGQPELAAMLRGWSEKLVMVETEALRRHREQEQEGDRE